MIRKSYLAVLSLCTIIVAGLLPSEVIAQNEIRFEMAKTTHKIKGGGEEKPTIYFLKLEKDKVQVSGYIGTPKDVQDKGGNVHTKYMTEVGGTLVVKGNPEKIRILLGYVEKADLSKAPKSLKVFWMRGTKTKEFDLSGATELEDLVIRNQKGLQSLDLSALKKAKILQLGKFGVNNQGWSLKTVKMPKPSAVEYLDFSDTGINQIDLSNLPHLKRLCGSAAQISEVVLNSPKIEAIEFSRAHLQKLVLKGSTPKLHKLWLQDIFTIKEIIIPDAPKLKDGVAPNLSGINGLCFTGNPFGNLVKMEIKNSGITQTNEFFAGMTPNLAELDLTGAPIVNFDFTKFPKLRKIRMPIDKIKEADFDKIINTLPILQGEEKGYFEVAKTDATNAGKLEAFEQKLKAKGWNTKIPAALDEIENTDVKIYPTRTTDLVKIEGAKANATYAIFAMNGTLCEKGQTDGFGSAELHLSSYAKGVYIIKLGKKYQKIVLK